MFKNNTFSERFNQLKIRTKLLIFLIAPLGALVIFGGLQTAGHYQDLTQARESKLSVAISLQLDNLIHELQKERGLTAGFSGSHGRQFKDKLFQQRQQTDFEIKRSLSLAKEIKDKNWPLQTLSGPESIKRNFIKISKNLKDLEQKRASIDSLQNENAFNCYTNLNTQILQLIEQLQVVSTNIHQTRYSHDFLKLLWLQERAGQERGALNGVLISGSFDIHNLQQVITYASAQNELIQGLISTTTEHHQEDLNYLLNSNINHRVEIVREAINNKVIRSNIINDIQRMIGYNGLIHNFKNYILRGEQRYIDEFSTNIRLVFKRINDFKSLPKLTEEDLNALQLIEQTMRKYQNNIPIAAKLRKTGTSIEDIDDFVSVDDTHAIQAINFLKHSTLSIDSYHWWSISSERIDRFRALSTHIREDMKKLADNIERHSVQSMLLYLILFFITLSISLYLSYLLLRRLVGEVGHIANEMKRMQCEHDFDKPLNVNGSDEISRMAQAFNNMLNERQKSAGESKISEAVFEYASEAIMITNADNKIEMVNPAFSLISGYSKEDVMGQPPSILQSGRHGAKFYQEMWNKLLTNGSWQGEIWNRRKNGEIFPEFLATSVVRDKHNNIIQFISLFSDMTKHKKYEEDIWYQANFDGLTGLPNRNLCLDRLNHEMQSASRCNSRLAVLFIDLDRFKYINDTMGHNSGDELLQIAATRISQCLRKGDIVSRIGGDEFVVTLPGVGSEYNIERVAECIINSLSTSFCLSNQHEAIVSASIGITLFPDDGDSVESLLKNADTAMYQAKESGRSTFRFFTNDMNEAVMEYMQLEQELRKAVNRQEFCLHYQPVVSLETGKTVGAEALIRWRHPTKGLIYPDQFIGIAEETGLIEPIGEWVLQQALKDLKQWHELGFIVHMAVNVSSRQCKQSSREPISKVINRALQCNNLAPRYLKIEITESLLMDNSQETIDTLQTIRDLGVAIHMDDFGTGYSSLSYLKRFPIDVLKIDRSFISGALDDPSDASLVEAVVMIGHSLNLQLVGEGIETQQHFDYLKQLGCDYGQGYHMSKPIEAKSFMALLKALACQVPHKF